MSPLDVAFVLGLALLAVGTISGDDGLGQTLAIIGFLILLFLAIVTGLNLLAGANCL